MGQSLCIMSEDDRERSQSMLSQDTDVKALSGNGNVHLVLPQSLGFPT